MKDLNPEKRPTHRGQKRHLVARWSLSIENTMDMPKMLPIILSAEIFECPVALPRGKTELILFIKIIFLMNVYKAVNENTGKDLVAPNAPKQKAPQKNKNPKNKKTMNPNQPLFNPAVRQRHMQNAARSGDAFDNWKAINRQELLLYFANTNTDANPVFKKPLSPVNRLAWRKTFEG
jgi:hypothetical protein